MTTEQLSLFDLFETEESKARHTEPVRHDEHMSIHGLVYELEPVKGWVEVRRLCIYRPPHHKKVADKAWVYPDSISCVIIQNYKLGNRTPLAWGFGPRVLITKRDDELGSFDLADHEDYYWIDGLIREREREKVKS